MIESFTPPAESKDNDADKKSEGSKEKKVDKRKIGTFTAKNMLDAPNIHRIESGEKKEKPSVWQEILGQKREKDVEAPDKDTSPKKVERATEKTESDEKIDELGDGEDLEVVQRIAEGTKDIVATAVNAKEAEPDTTEQAENAIDIIFLDKVQQKSAENPKAPVAEILDEAETETVEELEAAAAEAAGAETDAEAAGKEGAEADPTELTGPAEGEIPLHAETDESADNMIVIPRAGSTTGGGSGGAGGSGGSTGGGSGGGAGGSSSSSSGGSGSGGGPTGPGGTGTPPVPPTGPPIGPSPGGPTPFGGPGGPAGFNAAPTPAPGVSIEDLNRIVHRQERIAIAQGLLVGGILGYLIGKRRGRIKTERRLLPIQNKLEKQVVGLQQTVLEREQRIRNLAAERAKEMANDEQRQRFVARMQRAEAIRASTERERQQHEADREAVRKRHAETGVSERARLGRMVVEAPAVLIGGATGNIGANRLREAEAGIEASRDLVTLSRNIESYTGPELKQAAEKIRIDGTSLKEMYDRGQLNERQLKRVIAEFVEGHSVRAALNRELLDEVLRYERDPKIRQAMQQRNAAARGNGVNGGREPAAQAGAAMLLRTMSSNDSDRKDSDKKQKSSNPQEDKSTKARLQSRATELMERARNQPTSHIVGAGAAIIGLIAALLYLF